MVHVFAPNPALDWSEVATLSSPIADIGNFGAAVHMDEADDTIIVGATAYSESSWSFQCFST